MSYGGGRLGLLEANCYLLADEFNHRHYGSEMKFSLRDRNLLKMLMVAMIVLIAAPISQASAAGAKHWWNWGTLQNKHGVVFSGAKGSFYNNAGAYASNRSSWVDSRSEPYGAYVKSETYFSKYCPGSSITIGTGGISATEVQNQCWRKVKGYQTPDTKRVNVWVNKSYGSRLDFDSQHARAKNFACVDRPHKRDFCSAPGIRGFNY